MRYVVEEHEARLRRPLEIEDVQASRALIEAVAIRARIEADQRREETALSSILRPASDSPSWSSSPFKAARVP